MKARIAVLCILTMWPPAARAQVALIGISPNVPKGGTVVELVQELKDLQAGGMRGAYISAKWSDLEPHPGEYNLKPIEDGVRGLGGMGFTLAVTIQTLDTNNRTLPSDLQDKPFGAPEMKERFLSLLRAIGPRLTKSVRWVMLGNEVDIYLAQHRGELGSYTAMVEAGADLVRKIRPGAAVGVTCTYDGLRRDPSLVSRLNEQMDVVALTYYPLMPDFGVRAASDVRPDIDRMVKAAAGKPLLLQEAGYPASPLLGSSEEKQADFVDAVFDATKAHAGQIAFVNFFLYCDFSGDLVSTFLKYYRLPNERFRAYLGTLGLKRTDGTPRQAWGRFAARLKSWSPAPASAGTRGNP